MLVLARESGQRIKIGNDIVITMIEVINGKIARIGVEAPSDVPIHREEVWKVMENTEGGVRSLAAKE